jgi:hypothetical protein
LCLSSMAAAAAAQTVVLNQPATSSSLGGGVSDSGCTFGSNPNASETLADDFVLTEPHAISGVRFQGGYSSTASPAHPPVFTIRLWTDSAGLPGTMLATPVLNVAETPVNVSGNLWVFSYTASFSAPVSLGTGTYWMEILETDATIPACFTWSSGVLDPVNGRNGAAVQFPINGTWLPQATDNYSLVVFAEGSEPAAEVPALGAWGLLALIAGLATAALALLRRQQGFFVGR